jgi:hypothetical protein
VDVSSSDSLQYLCPVLGVQRAQSPLAGFSDIHWSSDVISGIAIRRRENR